MIQKKWVLAATVNLILMGLAFSAGAVESPTPTKSPQEKKCELAFRKLNLCATLEWVIPPKKVEMPTEKDRAEFLLSFYKKGQFQQTADPGYSVFVRLFMPTMGHGSHPTQVRPEIQDQGKPAPGVFRVSDVYFSMPGAWEIQVELRKAGKTVERAVIPYQL